MCDRHCLACSIFSKPELSTRSASNSTWLICILQREYSSFTSLCIFNDFSGEQVHAEEKFFNYWRKRPSRIFPDLQNNEIDKGDFDLVWYMLRSPCSNCTRLILKFRSLYKTLTIITASVCKYTVDAPKARHNRIANLRLNGVKVEPMSLEEYKYFTKGRRDHELPTLTNFSPEQDFRQSDLRISPRIDNFSLLPPTAHLIRTQFMEEILVKESCDTLHCTPSQDCLTLPSLGSPETTTTNVQQPTSSKHTHDRHATPSILQRKRKRPEDLNN